MLGELLRKIGRNTLIYGLGGVLQRIVGFLMVPVYTHYLSTNDYGTIELLDLTSYVAAMFVGLGLGSAVVRSYYDYEEPRERNEVISTAILFIVPVNAAVLVLLHFLSGPISRLVFGQAGNRYFFNLVFISLVFSILNGVLLSYVRAKQQAVLFAVLSVLQLTLGLGLNIYLIAGRRMGVLGSLYSGVITQAVMSLLLLSLIVYEVRFRFSTPKLQAMLRFGAPLIPAGIGMFVLNFADRFFLRKYSSLSVVGTYALGYKIGMSLNALLLTPFYLFWSAYMYEVAQEENAKELFARVYEYLMLGLLFGALGISLFGRDAVSVLAPPSYWAASQIVPIIALSYMFSGLFYYFQLGMALSKRTEFRAYAVGASALLNILLNFLLIPRYGAYGAAWATLFSFLVLAGLSHYFSQRLYRVPYHFGKLVKATLIAATIFACAKFVRLRSLPLNVLLHAALLACFPLVLWVVRFYSREEKEIIRKLLLSAAGRLGFATKQSARIPSERP